MKTLLPVAIISIVLTCVRAAEGETWPGTDIIALSESADAGSTDAAGNDAHAAGLNSKLPETYDWNSYFTEARSTYDEGARAVFAAAILWRRLVIIESRFRASLTNAMDQLAAFDRIQAKWRDLAAEETEFVARQWTGGSGQKAAIPRETAQLIRMRINALRTLQPDSAALFRE